MGELENFPLFALLNPQHNRGGSVPRRTLVGLPRCGSSKRRKPAWLMCVQRLHIVPQGNPLPQRADSNLISLFRPAFCTYLRRRGNCGATERTKPMTDSQELDLLPGNVKKAVGGATSGDLWMLQRSLIRRHPKLQPRDNTTEHYKERVRHLADLMHANGYDRSFPLKVFAAREDDQDVLY